MKQNDARRQDMLAGALGIRRLHTCASAKGERGPEGVGASCVGGSTGRMEAGAIANGDSGPAGAGAAAGIGDGGGRCCGCAAARAKLTEVCFAMRFAMERMPTVRSRIAAVAACVVACAACRLTSPASDPYLGMRIRAAYQHTTLYQAKGAWSLQCH